MGYYISLRASNFYIENDKKEEALKLFKDNMLSRVDELGRGGCFAEGKKKETWFSWTDTKRLQETQTIEDVIKQFGWEPETDNDGNIVDLYFDHDKMGQEDLLFDTIAPCVRAGSYLDMEGEEGDLWRWYFDGEQMLDQTGKVTYA
jgi:hypothetical protein